MRRSWLFGLFFLFFLPLVLTAGSAFAATPPRPINMNAVRNAPHPTAAYQAELERYRQEVEAYAQDLASRQGSETAGAILQQQGSQRASTVAAGGEDPALSGGSGAPTTGSQTGQGPTTSNRLGHGPGLNNPAAAYGGLLESIHQNANQWWRTLQRYAINIFLALATIQLVMTFIPLVLRGADLGEIVNELVKFFLVIGFFAALLMYGHDWAEAIVNSFWIAGGKATGLGEQLWPGDALKAGVQTASMVIATDARLSVHIALAHVFAAGVVLVCFCFIAAFLGLTLIESYIVINASVLFLAPRWQPWWWQCVSWHPVFRGLRLWVIRS